MLKADEIRAMDDRDRAKQLAELRQELMHERGIHAMGGSSPNPGKIRTLRRDIARILTIQREAELAE